MNWGYKMMFVFIAFGTMIGTLVYKCMHTSFDLVSKEYYKEELAYQQVIDGTQNARALHSRPDISRQGDKIWVTLPAEMKGLNINVTVLFYCPSDARRDIKQQLTVNPQGMVSIPYNILLPGNYIVKLSWLAEGKQYYAEKLFSK